MSNAEILNLIAEYYRYVFYAIPIGLVCLLIYIWMTIRQMRKERRKHEELMSRMDKRSEELRKALYENDVISINLKDIKPIKNH